MMRNKLNLLLLPLLLIAAFVDVGLAADASQPLACTTVATSHSDGTWSYAARMQVVGKAQQSIDFAMRPDAAATCSATKITPGSGNTINISLSEYSVFPVGPFNTHVVPNAPISTTTCSASTLGLGPRSTLLQSIWASDANLAHTVSYCLVPDSRRGELAFGRQDRVALYYNSDVLNETSIKFTYLPLDITASSYQLALTGVGLGTPKSTKKSTTLQISATQRYTTLPQQEYNILRSQLETTSTKFKIKKALTKFGQLDLCYQMTSAKVSKFPKLVLAFGKQANTWTIWPENYLVSSPKAKNVACLAMVATTSTTGVIGTFQQEENWIQYDIANKRFGVTGYVPRQLCSLSCASTTGV